MRFSRFWGPGSGVRGSGSRFGVRVVGSGARVWVGVVVAAMLTASPGGQAPAGQTSPARDLTKPELFRDKAPETFLAVLDTTIGIVVMRVRREWAPHGADRFYNLVKHGFYDGCRFFRVIKDFAAQFGINGDPKVSEAWDDATLPAERARA